MFLDRALKIGVLASLGLFSAGAQATSYIFSVIDVSSQFGTPMGETTANGINNAGQIVGSFGSFASPTGFLLSGGIFTAIEVPGSLSQSTVIYGINNAGQIAGSFRDTLAATTHGFVSGTGSYSSAANYTRLDAPFATIGNSVGDTYAFGVNNNGQVAGSTVNGSIQHGFSVPGGGTPFTQVDIPGALDDSTQVQGLNDLGDLTGYFTGLDGVAHGFVLSGTTVTQLDAPFANVGNSVGSTQAAGINNLGQVVGWVVDATTQVHGFVYDGGTYTQINVPLPGAHSTFVFGINDLGQIVGEFSDDTGRRGFVASPVPASVPEPATALILGGALLGLAGLARRERRTA